MKQYSYFSLFLSCIILIQFACKPKVEFSYDIASQLTADTAMIVSAHPLASEAGLKVLRDGGNAMDATAAVQFALAVVYPRAGNLGGGGFMIYRSADGKFDALDFREKAPAAATRDMYLDDQNELIEGLSRDGGLAVGVPGTVDGIINALNKYGSNYDLSKIITPAYQLAKEGFRLSPAEAERLNKYMPDFKERNPTPNPFTEKEHWKAGDLLIQTELANSLKAIMENSRDGFYTGRLADKLVETVKASGGIISKEDLKNYKSIWRTPVIGQFKEYKIISMPPPSSGGIALTQLLRILEDYPLDSMGFQTTASMHLISEAERRVYADRAQHLGDSDFYPVPMDSMLAKAYLLDRMADYDSKSATVSEAILAGTFNIPAEGFQTTHTSVVDEAGNAIALTTTLNLNYGSKLFVDGAGFFLNNEMDDFSAKPGTPNFYGLVGAEANAIAPNKRMLSSMTPTIIEKNGKLFMVLGTPGGSTIITSVLQTFLNVACYDMSLPDAVAAKRFHHQWLPDQILLEENFHSTAVEELKKMGHQIEYTKKIGVVKAIHKRDDGKLIGSGDLRNPDDHVVAY